MSAQSTRTLLKALGPGILFAGCSVGVSHLVQSTRAGAGYGLGLVAVIILASIVKYPAFRFAPAYTIATGTSLLEGYRRRGVGALVIYALVTIGVMFAVQAAVTFVTAGLGIWLLDVELDGTLVAGGLLLVCAGLLVVGHYRWLDRIVKVVVAVLALSTVAATLLVLFRTDWSQMPLVADFGGMQAADLLFLAALVGWMPTAIDVSVWHSLWTQARTRDTGHRPKLAHALMDFQIGYWGTCVLALCFLILGAGIMYGSGTAMRASAGGFATQLIEMYTEALGAWSRYLIAVAAFAVMFSTTLTCLDGFPRALAVLVARFRGEERPGGAEEDRRSNVRVYWLSLLVIASGSLLVIWRYLNDLKAMVDLATTLSFLTAPILAWLNHKAMCGSEVPAEYQPGPGLRRFSTICMIVLWLLAAGWLWVRFGSAMA